MNTRIGLGVGVVALVALAGCASGSSSTPIDSASLAAVMSPTPSFVTTGPIGEAVARDGAALEPQVKASIDAIGPHCDALEAAKSARYNEAGGLEAVRNNDPILAYISSLAVAADCQ